MVKKCCFLFLFSLLLGHVTLFAGGNAEPFTKKILNNFSLDELKRAQFYMDNALTLTRVIPYGESRGVEEGAITILNGEKIEKIEIPKNTGGELMELNNSVLGICFSSNNTV